MSNITNLKADLEEKKQADMEANADNFNQDYELTEEEQARIDKMRTERAVMVTETDANGKAVSLPADEYAKSLDKRIVNIKEAGDRALKLVNNGDIKESVAEMKERAKQQAINAFRSLSVDNSEISDDDYIAINDDAIKVLMDYFKMDRMDADVVVKKLSKLSLPQICEILPQNFVDIYVSENERKANNIKAKERLLSSIAYLSITGPEMDYLNEYIDEENKLAVVSKRLMQCQMDFTQMIQDDTAMSELLAKTYEIEPVDTSFWSSYISNPKRVHNEFAQRVVIFQEYKAAYGKVLDDYPDTPDNQKAREMILAEIQECDHKIDVYSNVCDLELLKKLWDILTDRLKANKKTCLKSITNECIDAVERIRRSKQNVPFPGYNGTSKKADMIFSAYIVAFGRMVLNYNTEISKAEAKGDEVGNTSPKNDVAPIRIEGYEDNDVATAFAMLLLLAMGRVMKALSKNDADKYDAITLDAYFQVFCKLGTDIYLMTDVWGMMREFVQYFLDTWYLPEKSKVKK